MVTEDMELVRQYATSHSEEAFAMLVSRHVNLVYSVALRQLRDPHLAEEATQAAFIVLTRKAAALGPKTILSAWLCRTVQYVAANALKAQRRRQCREQEAYMQSISNAPATDSDPWLDIAPLLDTAMAGLGAKDHSAIVLRFFEGKDLRQVGSALGVSENAAKTRVCRAVEKLRKFFLKRGVTLSGAAIADAISANSVQAAPATLAKSVTMTALAKGTAASASTMLLAKGALKLMAWGKAQTAIVACSAILLGVTGGVIAADANFWWSSAPGPDIQGAWEGKVALGKGAKRLDTAYSRVVLRIAQTNGVYDATLDYIDMGSKDAMKAIVHQFAYKYPIVRFGGEPWGPAELKLNREGTKMMVGSEVVLERTNAPDAFPDRLVPSDYAPRSGSPLQGCWQWNNRFFWKIAESADGNFRSELDSPPGGSYGIPINATYNPPSVKLQIATGRSTFQGKINNSGTEIKGISVFGGNLIPMILKRCDSAPEPALPESDYAFVSTLEPQGHWTAVMPINTGQLKNWKGLLPINPAQLKKQPVDLDVAKLPDGTFSATLSWPFFIGGEGPVPVSDFQCTQPNLRVELKSPGVVFEATLSDGKLAGKWREGGQSYPVTFERSQT